MMITLSSTQHYARKGVTKEVSRNGGSKSKVSKQRRDKRRANWKLAAPAVTTCPKCGAYRLPHRLCTACMTYDGKVFGQVQEN